MNLFIIFGVVFIVCGIILFVNKLNYRRSQYEKIFEWRNTTAKRIGKEANYSYIVDGAEYTWKPGVYYNDAEKVQANEIEIFYNPEKPEEATAYHAIAMGEAILWSFGFILVGAIMVIAVTMPANPDENLILNAAFIGFCGGTLFAAIGAGFLISLIKSLFMPLIYKNRFEESTAVCVRHSFTPSRRGRLAKQSVFEYEADGMTYQMGGHTSKHSVYTTTDVLQIGETARIWINPENPREAYVEMKASRYYGLFSLQLFLGIGFIFPGLLAMFVTWGEIEQFSITLPSPRIESHAPVPFEPFGSFDSSRYDALMEKFENEFATAGGVILMEVYEESFLELLNDPTVSPLQRARDNNFLVEHFNPVELYIIRAEGFEIIYSDTNKNAAGHNSIEIGHGSGIILPGEYIGTGTHEYLTELMQYHKLNDKITEAQLILFDDPHLRYSPALFVWYRTEGGTFIFWLPLDDNSNITLFPHFAFADRWKDFIETR